MKENIMEPSDIDKIIKGKLTEVGAKNVHRHEMDQAKPFVWSAVQNNLSQKKALRWYHLAAAILLLLIGFGFGFNEIQKNHQGEIALLHEQLRAIKTQNDDQILLLGQKELELQKVADQLQSVELQLANLEESSLVIAPEKVLYRTDTVIIKQVEYVPAPNQGSLIVNHTVQTDKTEENISMEIEADNIEKAIYPSYTRNSRTPRSENMKVKFLGVSRN